MGDVDKLQDAEEEVAQLQEERAARDHQAQLADLSTEPVKATAGRTRSFAEIPLSLIHGGSNMRTGELPEIQSLAVSIREVGLINPLLVRAEEKKDKGYRLIAGRRRRAALQLNHPEGEESIHCEILSSDADEAEQWVLMLTENLQREDPPPLEIAKALRSALRLDPHLKASALARALGKSPAWASRHLHLLDLPEKVQWRIESGDLNFTIADLIRQGQKNGVISDDEMAISIAGEMAAGAKNVLELKKLVRPRTRVPDVPENYDELSRELDAARFGPREAGYEPNELSPDVEDRPQGQTRRAPRVTKGKGQHGVRQLESYLIGRLLRDSASATLLRRFEVTPERAYSFALNLGTDEERRNVLHELAADMMSSDHDLPEELSK